MPHFLKSESGVEAVVCDRMLYPPFIELRITTYPEARSAGEFHHHPFFQTLLVRRGRFAFRLPTGGVIACRPGELLSVPAGVEHQWMVEEAPCEAFQILHTPLPLHLYGELFVLFGKPGGELHRVAIPETETGTVEKLEREILYPGEGSSVLIHGRLLELFALAVRQLGGRAQSSGRDEEAVFRALNFIDSHLGRHITLAELAAGSFLSVSRFSHLFRDFTGKPPLQYINELRIERAKNLLAYSEFTVSEIASELGFESLHYFSRLFRKTTGESPSAFRHSRIVQ